MPTAAELEAGKRYSCAPCGYGASNGFCLYADLPSVSFDMVLRGATADVAMRIGRDQRPVTTVERFGLDAVGADGRTALGETTNHR